MVIWLSVPTPRPTRKDDMAAAIDRHLSGASLRRLWDDLDDIGQLAVREALQGPADGLVWRQFGAKYGKLPPGLERRIDDESLPMRLFLYLPERHAGSILVVPGDLAEFVPPPPEATPGSQEELPETVLRTFQGARRQSLTAFP